MHSPLNSSLRVTLIAILATSLVKTAGSAPFGSPLTIIQPESLKIIRLGGVGVVVGMFEGVRRRGSGLVMNSSSKAHSSALVSALLNSVSSTPLCAAPGSIFMGLRCQPAPPPPPDEKCGSGCAGYREGRFYQSCGTCASYTCQIVNVAACCDACWYTSGNCKGCETFQNCKPY